MSLCSCGTPPPIAGPAYEHVVAALDRREVVIRVEGRIENRKPVGHAPPQPWLPIATFVREGSTVKPGDTLMTLDTVALQDDQLETGLALKVQQAEQARDRLQAEIALAELEDRRTELVARLKVSQAQLAAVDLRDREDLAVARLELRIAERSVEQARMRLKRVRGLAQDGAATPLALREAERGLLLAEARLRLPQARIGYLSANRSVLTRERLQLALEEIRANLGNAAGGRGVEGAIATARTRLEALATTSSASFDTLKYEFDQRQKLIDHPEVPATGTGAVAFRGDDVRAGGKYAQASLVYVMGQEELVVTLDLPERARDLVRGGGGRVRVHVDGVGEALPGRILSVAPAPRQLPGQARRTYPCTIRLDRTDPRLRVGMQASCDLALEVPDAAAVVPAWLIADRRRPRVVLADGTERELTGIGVGQDFVVLNGLAPGERLRLPGKPPASGQTRLGGVLDATEAQRIRLWGTDWELVDRLADGTPVKTGDLIARLTPQSGGGRGQMADSFTIAQKVMKATTNLVVARIEAEETLAKSVDAWQQAVMEVDKAQLELVSARFVATDDRNSAAALRLAQADATVARADEEAAEIDTPAVVAVSGQEVRRRRLEQALARLDRDRSGINEIMVLRERDWLRVLRRAEDVRTAEEAAQRARTDLIVARAEYRAALDRAQERHRAEMFDVESDRLRHMDEEVRAPVDGVVFQNPAIGKDGLKVGQRLPHIEPFIIPVGNRRTVEFEVPARFYGRFKVGQELPVVVPALGLAPRLGTVTTVAAFFLDSRSWRDEIRFAGAVGLSEKVFLLSVTFTFTDDELARVPPGATAHVDL